MLHITFCAVGQGRNKMCLVTQLLDVVGMLKCWSLISTDDTLKSDGGQEGSSFLLPQILCGHQTCDSRERMGDAEQRANSGGGRGEYMKFK